MRYLGRVSAAALLVGAVGVLQAAPWDHADAKIRGEGFYSINGPNVANRSNAVYYAAPVAAPRAPAVVQSAPVNPTPAPANGVAQNDLRSYRSGSVQPNPSVQPGMGNSYSRRANIDRNAPDYLRADGKTIHGF